MLKPSIGQVYRDLARDGLQAVTDWLLLQAPEGRNVFVDPEPERDAKADLESLGRGLAVHAMDAHHELLQRRLIPCEIDDSCEIEEEPRLWIGYDSLEKEGQPVEQGFGGMKLSLGRAEVLELHAACEKFLALPIPEESGEDANE